MAGWQVEEGNHRWRRRGDSVLQRVKLPKDPTAAIQGRELAVAQLYASVFSASSTVPLVLMRSNYASGPS
jgi:hypothetical protein